MPFQVPRQRPQRGQRGRAGPVQVIQADQDRSRRGSLFEVRPYLGDPPRSRIRQITTGIIGGEPGERLTQGRAQREERDRLAQLVRCSRGQGKAVLRGLVGGVAEQQGLADTRLPVHQHHAASPPLSAPQQVTDHLLFRRTSAQNLPAGRSLPRRHPPARSRGGITDHRRCHASVPARQSPARRQLGEPDACSAGSRGRTTGNPPTSAPGPGSGGESANASRATLRAQRIRITAVSG